MNKLASTASDRLLAEAAAGQGYMLLNINILFANLSDLYGFASNMGGQEKRKMTKAENKRSCGLNLGFA